MMDAQKIKKQELEVFMVNTPLKIKIRMLLIP